VSNLEYEVRPIKECIACGSDQLIEVLDLNSQPLANSYKKDKFEVQPLYPLAINRCAKCYHVQLTHQVNPELMFKDYLYVSGTAKTQLDYFNWFVDYIVKQYGSTPESVLDIGCNDGSFLNAWGGSGAKTYGVDPAENLYPVSSKNHSVHCGFFTGKEFGSKVFDVITCMNAFAHNANQLELLKNIETRMHEYSLLFCTTSQADMIINGEFDTIYHEHLSFYNTKSAEELCKRAGLNLIDVYKHPIHGTSYIFVISKSKESNIHVSNLIAEEKVIGLYEDETYKEYSEKCHRTAHMFSKKLVELREKGIPTIGYGAPAKGNTLMNFAINGPEYLIEDNPLKQGLWSPGLGIPIVSATEIYEKYKDVETICFVPMAWNFYNEIVSKIKLARPNKKDMFMKYFPELEIDSE